MNIAALETSGRDGSAAALATGAQRPDGRWDLPLPAGRRSAETLPAALRDLLAQTGWRPEQIDVVAVAAGPGSFTGLRVGVTAAKLLAYVAGARVVEVNTLAAIAAQAEGPEAGALWAVIDAQRGELFAARWGPGDEVGPDAHVELLSVQQWVSRLAPGDTVSGPILARLIDRLPHGVTAADPAHWSPRAATVADLALPRALAGETIAPEALLPHYHRLSAAEEKKQEKLSGTS